VILHLQLHLDLDITQVVAQELVKSHQIILDVTEQVAAVDYTHQEMVQLTLVQEQQILAEAEQGLVQAELA
jgi:hypothetical protein